MGISELGYSDYEPLLHDDDDSLATDHHDLCPRNLLHGKKQPDIQPRNHPS